ncbi:MAG: hypothetical protein J1E38_03225 [Paramuribaculum sp.]|nr:hypothetical protein [Paramuribaculum sp.]
MIKVGDTITFTRPSHGSVGIASEIKLDSNYFNCRISYNVPGDCAPGGDSGTKTYYLTALKSGLTTVEIIEYFRSEVTDNFKIKYRIKG